MSAATASDRVWLPLGSAQIVDWRHLDRDPATGSATAWVAGVLGETVLVRTWCEQETTTHFDYEHLARPTVAGRITVRVTRPDPRRLSVRVDVEPRAGSRSSELTQFEEHPRTGLQSLVARKVDGADSLAFPRMSARQVEIFEYAPESALHTECGPWLLGLLDHLTETVDGAPAAATTRARDLPEARAPERPAAEAGPRSSAHGPSAYGSSAHGAAAPGPASSPSLAADPRPPARRQEPERIHLREPTPPPQRALTPEPSPPPRLIAATNGGETWELVDDETFIGRSKQCAVVLKSQRVSRKHASVSREGHEWFINDLGAANGIWAGSQRIEREQIEDGAEYIIGDVVLTFSFA